MNIIDENISLYSQSPDAFIASMSLVRFLEDKNRILIVGDCFGRDTKLFKGLGKEVFVVDIASQEGIENFYCQSITEKTPFEDGFFDGVIMAEVLEHLFEDYKALNEINRILKPDGILAITIPYLSNVQDQPEYHVRMHSKKTLERLFAFCGFKIEEHFFRGFVTRLCQKNRLTKYLIFGPKKILKILFKERGIRMWMHGCLKLESWLGKKRLFNRMQKTFATYGGIMKCRKDVRIDFDKVQVSYFANMYGKQNDL
ncbi:class I SAM-dependent methyltransferase [Candidatus Babeliales bacterium]|nr:class I SAM-dependent methyltransferase [Candidatus Babeliales bacterium]